MNKPILAKLKGNLLLLLPFFFISHFSQAQTLVNVEWKDTTGLPQPEIEWSASIAEGSNLIVVGNTLTSGEGANVLCTKYDGDGVIEWQESFNVSDSSDDYGIDVIVNASGDIFICAATYNSSDTTSDYLVLKYQSDGTFEWDYTFDGSGGTDDIPTKLVLDSNEDLYVTGASQNSSGDFDYVTIKLDPSDGSESWVRTYDRSGEDDYAATLAWINNEIVVSGGSGASTVDWDYVTVAYSTSGVFQDEGIVENPGFGFDKPAAMTHDSDGNIYITGAAAINGTDYDIYTVKLDTGLNVVWDEVYGSSSDEDGGFDIAVDDSGNVIITGFSSFDGKKEITTLKYNNSGTLQWNQTYYANPSQFGIGKKLEIADSNEIIVAGTQHPSSVGGGKIILIEYDPNGDLNWDYKFEVELASEESPLALTLNTLGQIFLTSGSVTGSTSEWITIQLDTYTPLEEIVYDTSGVASHVKNEIIVRFKQSALKKSLFHNPDVVFGDIEAFVKSSVITGMENKVGEPGLFDGLKVEKVFSFLSPADTITFTRENDTIFIPDFWTTLSIYLPEMAASFTRISSIEEIIDSLNLLEDYIQYVDYNEIGEYTASANDSLYTSRQLSLYSTDPTLIDGHINIEHAWDFTTGNSGVTIGVIGSGIYFTHEDFYVGTPYQYASKVTGKEYYRNNVRAYDLNSINNIANPHETQAAGIIGALRNNSIGISGIAGGDINTNPSNIGCSLFAQQISRGSNVTWKTKDLAKAIIGGTRAYGSGLGLDIMSMSLRQKKDDVNRNRNLSVFQAVSFANRCKILMVASRGNDGADNEVVPGSYPDQLLVCVGGTDKTGRSLKFDQGGTSSFGKPMDLVGPGSSEVIYTTSFPVIGNSTNTFYSTFGKTSAATPHVA